MSNILILCMIQLVQLNSIVYSFQQNNLGEIRKLIHEASLKESRKQELSSVLHVYFKDWLYGNFHSLAFMSYTLRLLHIHKDKMVV